MSVPPPWQPMPTRIPFEELARTLEQARARERTALSQVLFILQNAIQRPLHLPARTLHFLEADQYMVAPEVTTTKYDIVLMCASGHKD